MTHSFLLINFIDKDIGNEIQRFHSIPQNIVKLGKTQFDRGEAYIKGIESAPNVSSGPVDLSSIWFCLDIEPRDKFEDNIILYKELKKWVLDSLYLLRFLINLNLKAKIFFHIEYNGEGSETKEISIQKDLDLYCDKCSSFHKNFNRYNMVFPLISKLLKFQPTDKFRAVMCNYANAQEGNSVPIEYFYTFTAFEGVINNWAKESGYSELWGHAVATEDEQESIQRDLKSHFQDFLDENQFDEEKQEQLKSFSDGKFPLPQDRPIRRSIKQKFKSYIEHRLNLDDNKDTVIQSMMSNFYSIKKRRNEIAHSSEEYTRAPRFTDDMEILLSTIKQIMDFELKKFLNGELDWKFEERSINLENIVSPKTQEKVLDKFLYSSGDEDQTNVRLRNRNGELNLERIDFQTKFTYENERIYLDRKLKAHFFEHPQEIMPNRDSELDLENERVLNIYRNPYFWFFTKIDDSQYIFKTLAKPNLPINSNDDIFSKFSNEEINMIVKSKFIDIPENSILFK